MNTIQNVYAGQAGAIQKANPEALTSRLEAAVSTASMIEAKVRQAMASVGVPNLNDGGHPVPDGPKANATTLTNELSDRLARTIGMLDELNRWL